VLRTVGRGPALLTLLGDVVKGWLAVEVATRIGGGEPVMTAIGAAGAVAGNCWSVFLGFRGGKGGATGLGASLRLAPIPTLVGAAVWLAVLAVFRYASLASITAALAVPVAALLLGSGRPSVMAAALMAMIVIVRHRENIGRLRSGTEPRLGQRSAST
jgi:acyl phosphate:glycerol-3-phosphate acyltransferase